MYRFCCLLFAAAAVIALNSDSAQAQQSPSLLPLPPTYSDAFASQAYSPHHVATTNSAINPTAYFEKGKKNGEMPPPVSADALPMPAESTFAPPNAYQQAMSDNWGGDCSSCITSACSSCDYWFGGVYALYMTRDNANDVLLSRDHLTTTNLVTSQDADMQWQAGAEVRFGRTICGGAYAWEAVYWGIYPSGDGSSATVLWTDPLVTNQLGTNLSFENLDRADGLGNVNTLVVGAEIHRVRRQFEFHNIEINFINLGRSGCASYGSRGGNYGGCGPRYNLSTSGGVRFMKLDESMQFASSATDFEFGDDLANENFYDVETQNFLIGFQLGSRGDVQWTDSFSTFAGINFGIYGNHMRQEQRVYNGLGQVASINNGFYDGTNYDISETKNDVAFLGEARIGLSYQLTNYWQLTAGYRAVALSGVALATDQVPVNFQNLDEARRINSNGSLILHGAFFGAEARF